MAKELDARLSSIAKLALCALDGIAHPRAADVGCDHGMLSAYLLGQMPNLTVLASDVSAPSLDKACRLLAELGLSARARFAVADGLTAIDEPVHAIVIAGMGAGTILHIVREGRDRIGDAALIVQANRDLPLLRAGLAELGFAIETEAYAEAAGRRYVTLLARAAQPHALSERQAYLGAAAEKRQEDDSERMAHLRAQRGVCVKELQRVAKLASPAARERASRRGQELRWIEEAMDMCACTAKELERIVGEIAPYELAEEWDNVGLLVGRQEREITRVLVALDATREVLDEARALGAQAIVTHHPMMFHARKRLTDADREGRLLLELAREDIALVAAHTNLDAAPGGVNDTLMRKLGCENVAGEGCVRAGELPREMAFAQLQELAQRAFGGSVRAYGPADARIRRVGCCSGAGGSELGEAQALSIDCFVTGEIAHHMALDAVDAGLCVLEAGHFETENPVCEVLQTALQTKLDALKYTVTVFCSKVNPFGRDV